MSKTTITAEALLSLVSDLIQQQVLELVPSREDPGTLYIPYMMNDAVEYYLVLKNVRVTGDLPEDFPEGSLVRVMEKDGRRGLLFVLPNARPALWFDECLSVREYYQYHRIGHFWRKGYEHWRMLVYMIGTISDKYTYLGPEAVNGMERSLLPLTGFGPFRAFSPVEESLDGRYPDSEEGWTCMRTLALEAGDSGYVKKMDHARLLMRLPFADRKRLEKDLEEALKKGERKALFLHIFRKICRASLPYPERRYSPAAEEKAGKERQEISLALKEKGFAGTYPLFTKEASMALALEEHPFTVEEIDYEGFAFGIRLMVWEESAPCPRILKREDLTNG